MWLSTIGPALSMGGIVSIHYGQVPLALTLFLASATVAAVYLVLGSRGKRNC